MNKRILRTTSIAATAVALAAMPAAALADGGASPGDTPPPVFSSADQPQVPGNRVVIKGGLAYAPAAAPLAVKQIVWAANKIRTKPYIYGGGHSAYSYDRVAKAVRLDRGYDCSGSVSFALHGANLLRSPLVSGDFPRWSGAERGRGAWISIFANAGHVYMTVAGARFDTSGARGNGGNRWQTAMRSASGYAVVHPRGL